MQSKYYFISVLLLSSVITGSAFSQTIKDSSYFPLVIGNKWVYEPIGYSYADTITVVDTQRVNGKLYYAVKENSYRYNWFRKDNDKIYIVDTAAVQLDTSNIREYLVYDFSANIGQNWNVPLTNEYNGCDYGGKVTLESKSNTVVTSMNMFTKCYYFSRGVPCKDAGRGEEWFAAGIGRVAYYEASYTGIRKFFLSYSNITTGIFYRNNSHLMSEYKLLQNYPNPFNPTTKICFSIPKRSQIKLKIFDVLGREVTNLAYGVYEAGKYEITFDASRLPSGIYFYNLTTASNSITKKMLLIK